MRKIVLNSRELEYELTRKRVKNINLRIKPDGRLCVSANVFVSTKRIDDFLVSHADKIIKTLDRFAEKQQALSKEHVLKNGTTVSILGENKILKIVESNKSKAEIVENELLIYLKDPSDELQKEKVFASFKKSLCETVIKQICDNTYPRFEKMGILYPTIKFRKMKSRWGSCHPKKGILTFNTHLVLYPIEAIEYVVMHEFVHFLHPDHSKSFYRTLDSFMPDWKERKRLL